MRPPLSPAIPPGALTWPLLPSGALRRVALGWLNSVSCLLQSTQAHENSKDGRLAWTGTQEHLVSTGFNQVGLLSGEQDQH